MTTTNLLTEYWDGLPDGTPVLILTPSGDKLACSPRVDADGTLVLVPEGHSERDMDTEFAEMRAAAEDAEVRCVRAENALAASQARVEVLETQAAAHTQGHAEQYFEQRERIVLLERVLTKAEWALWQVRHREDCHQTQEGCSCTLIDALDAARAALKLPERFRA